MDCLVLEEKTGILFIEILSRYIRAWYIVEPEIVSVFQASAEKKIKFITYSSLPQKEIHFDRKATIPFYRPFQD